MVKVQFTAADNPTQVIVSSCGTDTVRMLKNTITRDYPHQIQTQLFYKNTALLDHKTLADYNIHDDSIIVAQMQVFIFFNERDGIYLDVSPSTDIISVKTAIESLDSNYLVDNQRLFYKGINLIDNLSLADYKIDDCSNIFSYMRDDKTPLPKEGCIHVYVKTNKTIYVLDISNSDTVLDVKKKIVSKECNYMNQLNNMKLMFGERELFNSDVLLDCNIMSESLLHLFITLVEDDNADDDSEVSVTRLILVVGDVTYLLI